jgi:hypothetical protein
MMDFNTFKKAVDSLKDFPGIVGITGGEPTIHPRFDEFVRYYRSVIGFDVDSSESFRPQSDFMGYLIAERMDILRHNHRGLFTSLGEKYYEHFALIQDTFGVQLVNDHSHPSRHSALLITRAEMGIPDEEWRHLRDDCWVQKYWSASITAKGAFFCEVAAALDALLDGPGGWPIEPGWWKRTPADFADQLKWCELCGAALPTTPRDANDEIDEVSPLWKRNLEAIRSPKALAGLVRELDVAGYAEEKREVTDTPEPYFAEERLRMAAGQSALVPKLVTSLMLAPGDSAKKVLDLTQARDWVLVLLGTASSEDLEAMLKSHVFNPGCLYHFRNSPGRRPLRASFFNLRALPARSGLSLIDVARAYPESRKIELSAPASSGPWATLGLMLRCAEHSARKVRGCTQYLESLWSATITRPDDAALLWNILLGKLSRVRFMIWIPLWRSGWRFGAGIIKRLRAAWVPAWLVFVALTQLYVYRHTANGVPLAGGVRAVVAACFILAGLSMAAEFIGGCLLHRPYPERLRSGNAVWFVASVAAAFLYLASYLIRCGLAPYDLRRPFTLGTIFLVAVFTAYIVHGRGRNRRKS